VSFPRTKIQPPRTRGEYVERGAVEARLVEAMRHRRVVLVVAPAGYGKTSLVAHALAKLPPGVALAWVSADPGDNLQGLLECLLAAVEPLDPPWRVAPEALAHRVAEGPDEERDVAAELINTLEAIEVQHGVIVIDDLHRVEDPACLRFLDRLAERLGARWTLVLASRTEPAISLPRLRAAGELAEFRQLQLQFARDEARTLVTAAGLEEALADRVFDRTQGWPAGLRIAVGAVQGGSSIERALRSGERPMFEYLMTEVLDQIRPELADFLLEVSVLPELEASRCSAVSGRANVSSMLDEIERLGLFVDTLDAPGRTLRLHDLFREALQQRLRERKPAVFAQMRLRAAATEPDPARRIALLVEAGDLDEAAALAFRHVPPMIVLSGPAAASHALGQFPAEFRERSPEILFVRGLLGWVHWDFLAMKELFARAERGFAAAGRADEELLARVYRATILIGMGLAEEAGALLDPLEEPKLRRDVRIVLLNARKWLAIDTLRLGEAAPLLTRMLDLLEEDPRVDLTYHTSTPMRVPGLPGIARPLGRHAELMLRAAGDAPNPLRPLGLLAQAWGALWRGDLAESRELRERAREEADWSGNTGAVRNHMLTLTAFSEAASGDFQRAIEAALTRVRTMQFGRREWSRYQLGVFGARIAAACNDPALVREMLAEVDSAAVTLETAGTPVRRATELPIRAQLAWLEGRHEEAVAQWRSALEQEEAIDTWGQASEARVRLAAAHAAGRGIGEAVAILGPFFDRLAIEGGPRAAVLAHDALRVLADADWGDALLPERQALLRRWSNARAQPSPTTDRPVDNALSARELEVLERIAAGESNKIIARALDLSLHTVKRHVANILAKLGVETRGQAAAWLRRGDRGQTT